MLLGGVMANWPFSGTIWGSSSSGITIFSGIVDTYANLPDASLYNGNLYYVKQGSGGLMSVLGFYKYPAGAYISDGTTWVLSQFQTKISEDAISLVNCTNWAEFVDVAPTINAGDRIVFNGFEYINRTGNYGVSDPSVDTANWYLLNINENTTGFLDPRKCYCYLQFNK
jgi:hypothetical protein